jgi:hypothetical protein
MAYKIFLIVYYAPFSLALTIPNNIPSIFTSVRHLFLLFVISSFCVFHVTGDEDGEVLAPPTGPQASSTADGDGQGGGGDQYAVVADGVQAERLSNGDFQFPVSIILLDQLPVYQ